MSDAPAHESGEPIGEVADRLHSAAIHFLRAVAREDRESGVSPARLSALSVVVFAGPLTLGELADAERVRSATMTGIVNGLQADGLVRRRAHPSDQRAVMVEATAAGRRLLARTRARRIGAITEALAALPPSDVAMLGRAATVLDRAFAVRSDGGLTPSEGSGLT